MREVVAECENPVMLYSIGKDSGVMLHLAMKAFYPSKPPFPLMHVDTTWKFREMYALRDNYVAKELGLKLIVHVNQEGLKAGAIATLVRTTSATSREPSSRGRARVGVVATPAVASMPGGRSNTARAPRSSPAPLSPPPPATPVRATRLSTCSWQASTTGRASSPRRWTR